MGDISIFRLLLAAWVVTAALLVAVIAWFTAGPGSAGHDWRSRLRSGAAAFGLAVGTGAVILGLAGLPSADG